MEKKKLKIFDKIFCPIQHPIMWGHKNTNYLNLHNYSKHIEWIRESSINVGDIVFFTDFSLKEVLNINVQCLKIAWLIEPYEVWSDSYNFIKDNYDKFKILPIWCTWIRPEDQIISKKTKTLSIIASNKKETTGQKLRHEIISLIKDKIDIDIFGGMTSCGVGYNPIVNKSEGLSEYMFSIIIENVSSPYLFTEKIIDCLLTGTIPIYCGASKINEFFNINGFILFDDISNINDIISQLSEKKYYDSMQYIIENFNIAKKYLTVEDYIYENILKKCQYI